MRTAQVNRKTNETDIALSLNLDGSGQSQINTGCGFLDHMLTLFSRHARMDLTVTCKGDTWVDDHHTVEDIGIALGEAFAQAIGEKRGIKRYGSILLPMDEALIACAMDLSGRSLLVYDVHTPTPKVGTFDTELVQEFFWGFVRPAGVTLHFHQMCGNNSHHILEGTYKAFGHALREACEADERLGNEIPSTKGIL